MRIDSTNRVSTTGRASGANRSGARMDFVPTGSGAPTRAAAQPAVQSMAGIDAILALQAVGDPLTAKRKAVGRGQTLLDMLDEVRADLLVGRVNGERLDGLISVLSEMRERTMPGLDALLDDIELRARVELAKFGRFPSA